MAGVYGYNPYQFYPQGQQMQYQSPQTYIGSQIPQQPQQPSMQTQQNGYTCRPVTSREEAVAVQTDYFSPGTIMPDLGHGMVYIKRFNQNTGSSDFLSFRYEQDQPLQQTNQFATRDELNLLRQEVEQLNKAGERTMIAPMNNPLMMLVQTMRGGGDPMQLLQKMAGAKSTSGSSIENDSRKESSAIKNNGRKYGQRTWRIYQ